MNSAEAEAVLADTARLADERGWDDVREFAAAIPPPSDPGVLLVPVADADTASVVDAYQDQALEVGDGTEPGCLDAALRANRIIVVLHGGALLDVETVAAVQALLDRPSQTVRLLISNTDIITDESEFALVQRRAWQLFVGDPGTHWSGQDLGERGCLIWSGRAGAAFLRERLARDHDRLLRWLAAGPEPQPELTAARGLRLLRLAAARSQPGPEATRVSKLREFVVSTRHRLDRRLESDLLADMVRSSLDAAEQKMLAGVPELVSQRLTAHPENPEDPEQVIAQYIEQGITDWRDALAPRLEEQINRLQEEVSDATSGWRWEQIAEFAPAAGSPVIPPLAVEPPAIAVSGAPATAGSPAFRPAGQRPVERYGTVRAVGAVSLNEVAEILLREAAPLTRLARRGLPVFAAAAVLASAYDGWKWERHVTQLTSVVNEAVRSRADGLRAQVPDRVRHQVDIWRAGVDVGLAQLECELGRARGELDEQARDTEQRLDRLSRRLADAMS